MNDEPPINPNEPYVLIEGPRYGDAEFCGRWLLAAHKANIFWKSAAEDPNFAKQVERLQVVSLLDLAMAALGLLLALHRQFVAFMIQLDSEEGELFAMLTEMGFFARTGQRYQMVLPNRLSLKSVKSALLRFASTEDEQFVLHPEHLITAIPFIDAKAVRERLQEMDEEQRNAERLILLETILSTDSARSWRNWYKETPSLHRRFLVH